MKHRTFDIPSHLALFVAGLIIVYVVSLTVQNLNDETIYHVLLPGVVTALPLLVWARLRRSKPPQKRSDWRPLRVSKTHRL